jgi:hypothetical protein
MSNASPSVGVARGPGAIAYCEHLLRQVIYVMMTMTMTTTMDDDDAAFSGYVVTGL